MEKCCNGGTVREINIPEEMPDFNSPGNVGSWRQIFAANVGRFVKLEISTSLDGQLRAVCGEIYAVGNQYIALVSGGKIVLADILVVKFATFE